MGKLAIFIPDTKDFTREESIGRGTAVYIHFKPRRGLFAARRLTRLLAERARGCHTCDRMWASRLELPLLHGDAGTLVHAAADRLLPAGTLHLALFPGRGWRREVLFEIARRVRFLELIGDDDLVVLAEDIEAETGLSVPVFPTIRESRGKLVMRLPGAAGGEGLDLTVPEESCCFLPPAPFRAMCAHVGAGGDTLAALLEFFHLPLRDTGIFLSNFTKGARTLEKDFI